MNKHSILLLFSLFIFNANSLLSQARLSSQAKISLLTCAPGDDLYSLFGHSAIRVKDPVNRIDLVFNYGIFDFDTPNFMLKFVRGKLLYKLAIEQYRRFEYQYKREKRPVIEQVFNLNTEEQQAVFDFLMENAKPKNANYKYDFFYDNCASRIKDVLKKALPKTLAYQYPNPTMEKLGRKGISFRNHLDYYLSGQHWLGPRDQHPWTDFGMDLILGMPADQIADFQQEMFLPESLAENLPLGILGDSLALTNAPRTNGLKNKTLQTASFWAPTPSKVFWLLAILSSLFLLGKTRRLAQIFDVLLFSVLGLSGLLFLMMWVGTDHQACYKNLNMLWANPLHILLVISILRKKINSFWKKYLLITFAINLILINCIIGQMAGWQLLPQEFHIVTIPILLMVNLRILDRLRNSKKTNFIPNP